MAFRFRPVFFMVSSLHVFVLFVSNREISIDEKRFDNCNSHANIGQIILFRIILLKKYL